MSYIPVTSSEQEQMLAAIGVGSVDELFADIPQEMRLNRPLALPQAMTEAELMRHCRQLAGQNISSDQIVSFLGAGLYDHHIPAAVAHLVGRSDFYTAYTPYQAEVSQGSLQAIYEYQTLICLLTGMDVANASVYDAATAIVEAIAIARSVTRRGQVIFADDVHPDHTAVARTYSKGQGWRVKTLETGGGQIEISSLEESLGQDTAAVVLSQPNFLGGIIDLKAVADVVHQAGALLIVCVNPVLLSVLASPGECGADIVVGEGQPLGNPLSFGGPTLGFFAAKAQYLRRLPGRIVGRTTDCDGRVGYVLTLQAREQHIRRQRASSNICSNQALNALAAAVYLALLGPRGLKEVAEHSIQKAHYLAEQLTQKGLGDLALAGPYGNEFVFRPKADLDMIWSNSLNAGYLPGLRLDQVPQLPPSLGESVRGGLLMAVTEKRTRAELDGLVSLWEELSERG